MEEQNTPRERTKEEIRAIQNANLRMFKPCSEMTEEELQRREEIKEKARQGTREYHKKKKTMNELAKALLEKSVTKEQVERILGEDSQLLDNEDDLTVAQVLNARMLQEAIQGNARAYELLRDTGGFAPKKEVELQADIITDADKSLIENLNQRLSG